MVGSDSTPPSPWCTNVGRQRLARSTLHPSTEQHSSHCTHSFIVHIRQGVILHGGDVALPAVVSILRPPSRIGGGVQGGVTGGSVGGGGSRWGHLGWWGGDQAPVTSRCPPSRVRARARVGARVRVTELVEPVLVL